MKKTILPLLVLIMSSGLACDPGDDEPSNNSTPTEDMSAEDMSAEDASMSAGDMSPGEDMSAEDMSSAVDMGAPRPCDLHAYHREQLGEVEDCAESVTPWATPPETRATPGAFAHRWVPPCRGGGEACEEANQARCLDGTRPAYYVAPAQCVLDGTCPQGSDRWVFFFQGGGSCGDLSWCYDDIYTNPSEARETSTAHPEQDAALGDHERGGGILSSRADNAFADAHRVKIYKCSFDRFMGDATVVEAGEGGQPVALHFHGRRITQAVLADLARANGPVTFEGQELPSLADAEQILFTGNSGGAGGLIQNVDWLSAQMTELAPGASVAAVIDARFQPGAETEAAWEEGAEACAGCDAYDFDASGVSLVQRDDDGAPIELTRDMSAFEPGGIVREFFEALLADGAVAFDESCAQYHADDPSPCFSEPHVLLNHLGTEAFFHEALFDTNHLNKDPGFWIVSPSDFLWAPASWARAERVVEQADTFMEEGARAHEPRPRVGIFLPGHSKHVSITNDAWFLDGGLCKGCGGADEICLSYHDAVVGWLQRGASFAWVEERPRRPGGVGREALGEGMTDAQFNGWRWTETKSCP